MTSKLNSLTTDMPGDGQKPYRLIYNVRDAQLQPRIHTLAEVLSDIEAVGLKPIGRLRGRASKPQWIAGRVGSFARIEGETDTERFGIALPFATRLHGTDLKGSRKPYPMHWLNNVPIREDFVRIKMGLWIDKVEIDLPELPFTLHETQQHLAPLLIEFLNETGLAEEQLGHKLPLAYIDYQSFARIQLKTLAPFVAFVRSRWQTSAIGTPAPSRETISACLETFWVRSRSRGPRAARG